MQSSCDTVLESKRSVVLRSAEPCSGGKEASPERLAYVSLGRNRGGSPGMLPTAGSLHRVIPASCRDLSSLHSSAVPSVPVESPVFSVVERFRPVADPSSMSMCPMCPIRPVKMRFGYLVSMRHFLGAFGCTQTIVCGTSDKTTGPYSDRVEQTQAAIVLTTAKETIVQAYRLAARRSTRLHL